MKKLVFLAILASVPFAGAQQNPPIPMGMDSVSQLDRLPLLRQGVWFHSVSSQDVTGGNDDGSALNYQYMENGRYVFLDTRGPACVQLLRTIRINEFTLESGFGGDLTIETHKAGKPNTEVFPLSDLYSGQRYPFLSGLINHSVSCR